PPSRYCVLCLEVANSTSIPASSISLSSRAASKGTVVPAAFCVATFTRSSRDVSWQIWSDQIGLTQPLAETGVKRGAAAGSLRAKRYLRDSIHQRRGQRSSRRRLKTARGQAR